MILELIGYISLGWLFIVVPYNISVLLKCIICDRLTYDYGVIDVMSGTVIFYLTVMGGPELVGLQALKLHLGF